MKKNLILIFTLFSICLFSMQAQNQNRNRENNQHKKFDKESFIKDRADFFTKELNLTSEEARNFIPMLNEFMEKKFEINRDARKARMKIRESKTDATYKAASDAFLDAKIKEAQLQKEYYLKFEKVLPIQKVFKLSRVETNFMQKVIQEHRQGHKSNN